MPKNIYDSSEWLWKDILVNLPNSHFKEQDWINKYYWKE